MMWSMPVIQAFGKLRQKDQKFKIMLELTESNVKLEYRGLRYIDLEDTDL